jgi:hypothetical protein
MVLIIAFHCFLTLLILVLIDLTSYFQIISVGLSILSIKLLVVMAGKEDL